MMTPAAVSNSAEEYCCHAHMLKECGRLDEAEQSYRQALALKPDDAEVYGDLGNVFKAQGKLDKAIASYRKALSLKPDYAKAYINLGVVLQEGGLLDEAAANYKRALSIKSDYVAAHFNLGALHMSLGQNEDALRSFRKAITYKPDLAQAAHMIAVLEGKTTHSAPHEYIKSLFNSYASSFENHLLHKLHYTIPQVLYQRFCALGVNGGRPLRQAIDLGCGTGLSGELFCQAAERLIGVDLSDRMLEIASDKQVYHALHQADIVSFLHESEELYDLFLATDVFVYVGKLETVFQLVKERSLPGAYFAFSTEWTDSDDFVLQRSARYAHSREYIKSLCLHFGFQVAHCEGVDLRKDQGIWIPGDIFILQLLTSWQ